MCLGDEPAYVPGRRGTEPGGFHGPSVNACGVGIAGMDGWEGDALALECGLLVLVVEVREYPSVDSRDVM